MTDLAAIAAAEREATPGRWLFTHLPGEDCWSLVADHNGQSMTRIADRMLRDLFRTEDAEFIAGARAWVPQLLAENDRLRAELAAARAELRDGLREEQE